MLVCVPQLHHPAPHHWIHAAQLLHVSWRAVELADLVEWHRLVSDFSADGVHVGVTGVPAGVGVLAGRPVGDGPGGIQGPRGHGRVPDQRDRESTAWRTAVLPGSEWVGGWPMLTRESMSDLDCCVSSFEHGAAVVKAPPVTHSLARQPMRLVVAVRRTANGIGRHSWRGSRPGSGRSVGKLYSIVAVAVAVS